MMFDEPNEGLPGRCRVDEHRLHRRLFLKGLTGGTLASVSSFTGLFENPVFAAETKKAQKHCILLWLCGAPSQFETWDPKPGRPLVALSVASLRRFQASISLLYFRIVRASLTN
ncbi:MAG: hypothetical protein WCK17_07380 [Verrucomicrobiota bacterium]